MAFDSPFDFPPSNIALEEVLRAECDGNESFLLTYINSTCVVIGRNQSPEHELVSPTKLGFGIPVFRRTSGGGAVYHDHGNLNWSFIVPGGLDDRASLLALIVEALRSQGIPASSGTRGEIMAGGYKIGGTASAAGKGTLLFHGTILVDADLSLLNKVLAAHLPSYQGDRTLDQSRQGVASVPAAVGNASWFHPGLLPQDLAGALSASTRAIRPADWTSLIDKNKVESMAQTYASPSWIYHRTQKGTL